IRSPRSSEAKSILSTWPARRTTSHSVICSAMPPETAADASVPACSPSPVHWPAVLTRSAAVTGRRTNSFLPPEKLVQSGLRSKVSGFGTSVTLFRPRSEEHATRTQPTAATAIRRNTICLCPCIATASTAGLDQGAIVRNFCVSTSIVINRRFRFRTRQSAAYNEAITSGSLRPHPRLREADRYHPRAPEEQKIHRQKGRQARYRHVSFNQQPNKIGNEVA